MIVRRLLSLGAIAAIAAITTVTSHAYAYATAASSTVATSAVTAPIAVGSAVPATTSAGSMFQVLFGLVVVLALLAGCAWLLRRFNAGKNSGGANIRIVGGVNVGTRERVMVVEVADQWIVVGVAPGRVTQLSTMPKQEIVADEAHPARNFSSWLAQKKSEKNNVQ